MLTVGNNAFEVNSSGAVLAGLWQGSIIGTGYLGTGTPSSGTYLRGDGTWASTSGIASTPGGSNTQIQYNNGGAFGGASNLVWNNSYGFLGLGTATASAQLHIAGANAISAAAWTTNGIGIRQDAQTYTDTSSSGTVASNYVDVIGQPTLAATHATTYTNAATLYVAGAPINGTNVTVTNPAALVVGSGNVGIGTTVPASPLHVYGSSTGGLTLGQIFNGSSGGGATLELGTGGTGRLFLTADGNGGGGVIGGPSYLYGIKFLPDNNNTSISFTVTSDNSNTIKLTGGQNYSSGAGNSFVFAGGSTSGAYAGGDMIFRPGNTSGGTIGNIRLQNAPGTQDYVYVNGTSGSVGIGSTSPQEPLDVAGPIKVAGTGSETCDTAHLGALRYNPTTGLPQMCINH